MLSTAELLLGISRHLSEYTAGTDRATLGQLEFAGRVLEIAVRLRGSGVSSARRVAAIGEAAGLSRNETFGQILPSLQALGWVEIIELDGEPQQVSEAVPPLSELVAQADRILEVVRPQAVERAALLLMDETTKMPVTHARAVELAASRTSEEDALRALRLLANLRLVEISDDASGSQIVFNPNIWSLDERLTAAALRAEDGDVHAALGSLIEEVSLRRLDCLRNQLLRLISDGSTTPCRRGYASAHS
jgi:hypothetical protein